MRMPRSSSKRDSSTSATSRRKAAVFMKSAPSILRQRPSFQAIEDEEGVNVQMRVAPVTAGL